MLGNVEELCLDFGGDYDQSDAIDPIGPLSNGSANPPVVARGGSYALDAKYDRAATRYFPSRNSNNRMVGFRICVPLNY